MSWRRNNIRIRQSPCYRNGDRGCSFLIISCSVDRHIDLEAHDLAEGVFREFRPADLEDRDLLVRNRLPVERVNVRFEVCFNVGNAVLFQIVLVGIDFRDDGIVRYAAFALPFVNDDVENAGRCREFVFDLFRVNILAVGENDQVFFRPVMVRTLFLSSVP